MKKLDPDQTVTEKDEARWARIARFARMMQVLKENGYPRSRRVSPWEDRYRYKPKKR